MTLSFKNNRALPRRNLFNGEGWSPVDVTALRQLCKGVQIQNHWDHYSIPANSFYSNSPIPIQPINPYPDYSGLQRGKVVVVGFFGEISGRNYWVTKCQCGVFELISERTLHKKPISPAHCCAECRLVEARRYQAECCELAERHGLNFEALRLQYKELRATSGCGKRNNFGLIHFIRKAINEKRG